MYEMAHAFHIFDRDTFLETGRFWSYEENDPACVVISDLEALDIDEMLDFEIYENMYLVNQSI